MSRRRIPENTADYARWLAREIEGRSADVRLSPETSLFVAMALAGYAEMLDRRDAAALPFVVTESTDDKHFEVIAAASNLPAATSAFAAATVAKPRAHLVLRHGVRIVSERFPADS